MTLSMNGLFTISSTNDTHQNQHWYYAECRILFNVMLNVVMLRVDMLNVVVLSIIMKSVVVPPKLNSTIFYRCQRHMCQCYKTFYHSNLQPFRGNSVIQRNKAILPWKLPWNGSKLPQYFNTRKSRGKSAAIIYRGNVLSDWHLDSNPWIFYHELTILPTLLLLLSKV